jgi:hypothetical protein
MQETVRWLGLLVRETGGRTRDMEDVRRMSHNPEVVGSNPAPATNQEVQVRGLIVRTAVRP